jgi:hypothetical protein
MISLVGAWSAVFFHIGGVAWQPFCNNELFCVMNAPLSAAGYSQLTIYNIMLLLLTSTLRIMDAMQAGSVHRGE